MGAGAEPPTVGKVEKPKMPRIGVKVLENAAAATGSRRIARKVTPEAEVA
jgi:hypothetical protein